MKKLILGLIILGVSTTTMAARITRQVYREGDKIVFAQPKTDIGSNEKVIRDISDVALQGIDLMLKDLMQNNVINESILSYEDLKQQKESRKERNKKIGDYTRLINEYIEQIRDEEGGEFSADDLYPDIYMIFRGFKLQQGRFLRKGGSFTLAALLMPVQRTFIQIPPAMIDKDLSEDEMEKLKNGKIVSIENGVDWTIVGWPSGDIGIGFGTGKGVKSRWGFGAIWESGDKLTSAADFKGVGAGLSWSFNWPEKLRNIFANFNKRTGIEKIPVIRHLTVFKDGAQVKAGGAYTNVDSIKPDFYYVQIGSPSNSSNKATTNSTDTALHANITGFMSEETLRGMVGDLFTTTSAAISSQGKKLFEAALRQAANPDTEEEEGDLGTLQDKLDNEERENKQDPRAGTMDAEVIEVIDQPTGIKTDGTTDLEG